MINVRQQPRVNQIKAFSERYNEHTSTSDSVLDQKGFCCRVLSPIELALKAAYPSALCLPEGFALPALLLVRTVVVEILCSTCLLTLMHIDICFKLLLLLISTTVSPHFRIVLPKTSALLH